MIKRLENFIKKRLTRIVWAVIFSGLIFAIRLAPRMDYLLTRDILLFVLFAIFYFLVGLDDFVVFLLSVYFQVMVIFSLLMQRNFTAEAMANLLFVAFGGLVLKKIVDFLR